MQPDAGRHVVTLPCHIQGIKRELRCLIDSGATMTTVSERLVKPAAQGRRVGHGEFRRHGAHAPAAANGLIWMKECRSTPPSACWRHSAAMTKKKRRRKNLLQAKRS